MLTYIPMSFLFSFKKGFGLKIGLGLRWVLGLGFGIGNLIGGTAGTVDPCARKTPVVGWQIVLVSRSTWVISDSIS